MKKANGSGECTEAQQPQREKVTASAETVGIKLKSPAEKLSFDEVERFDSSKPYNPGPLKLEIKSIKNSTRTDITPLDNLILNDGSGRSLITAAVLVSWMIGSSFKKLWSFIFVHGIDFLWTTIKNKLGYSDDHYETHVTLGSEHQHDHKHVKHDLKHTGWGWGGWSHHISHHGWPTVGHGWPTKGWSGSSHGQGWHYHPKNVHKKPYSWYHPASKLFEQPTIQYLPHGTEYTLYGYDQNQAYKYRRKYDNKFAKYKRKYYRKKGKEILKAERRKNKAIRRKKKKERRRKKAQAFNQRIKDWLGVKDKEDDDDDDDEEGEGRWDETSSEIEHGQPPQSQHLQDYDALPSMTKNQQFLRITRR